MLATTSTPPDYPQYYAVYPDCDVMNGDTNGDGSVNNFDISEFMSLLIGGNAAVYVKYTWDAENRLTRAEPAQVPSNGNRKLEFAYDYMGRRVEKKVWTWQTSPPPAQWVLTAHRRFVWAGWLMLMELDGLAGGGMGVPPVSRCYTWGLDLAGQMGGVGVSPANVASGASAGRLGDAGYGAPALQGAGGIGGLVAVQDTNGTPGNPGDDLNYVYTYDANGNVGQVVDLSAQNAASSMVAKYEYDPYGNVTASSGAYAATNPFRFSTKYWDDETSLGYWGERHYDPRLGRWINRDPMEEAAGPDLYAYVLNDPLTQLDPFGGDMLGQPTACPDGAPDGPGEPASQPAPAYHGDCPFCDSVCADKSVNSETRCQDGKPCTCICDGNIGNNNPGAPPGLGDCIAKHEEVHVNQAITGSSKH